METRPDFDRIMDSSQLVRFFIPDQSPARAATRIITYAIDGCPKILRRRFLHLILVAAQNTRPRPFRTGTSRELTCRQVDRLHRLGRRKEHPRSSAAPFRAATHADYSTCVPFRFLGFWPGAHEDAFLCTRGALAFLRSTSCSALISPSHAAKSMRSIK